MFKQQLRKGFTLIELLIVIVIIGILAVAVLSAINPIEQINKAEDARVRSDSNELLNAYERYYTTHGYYPWQKADPDEDAPDGAVVVGDCTKGSDGKYSCTSSGDTPADSGYLAELVNSGELKPEFLERSTFDADAEPKIYISVGTTADNLIKLCFDPVSKAYSDTATNNQDGSSGCTPDTTDCYLCVPE